MRIHIIPTAFPRRKQYLSSTFDLLEIFNLHPAYNKYVKESPEASGKGKGKDKEVPQGGDGTTPGGQPDPQQGEEGEEGGDKKKRKDTYRHLIKGTPGKY